MVQSCVNPDVNLKTGFTQYLNKARPQNTWSQYEIGLIVCKSKYQGQIWIYTFFDQYLHYDVIFVNIGLYWCKSKRPNNFDQDFDDSYTNKKKSDQLSTTSVLEP